MIAPVIRETILRYIFSKLLYQVIFLCQVGMKSVWYLKYDNYVS